MNMKKRVLIEPLNCPFCGTLPLIEPWHGGRKTKKLIGCDNDFCEVSPGITGETRKLAVEKWNSRA